MNLSKDILEKANLWAQADCFDKETKQEIQNLFDTKNKLELTNRFYRDLEFGTGGMRGIMGAGTARFNVYNVRRATQALALYLRKIYGDKEIKIALSYDSRINSQKYAEITCGVLAYFKIRTIVTKRMRPVPMLSFMVRYFECNAGVCITASHNPAQYNGYKIYWKSGGQLTAPHDKNILNFYSELTDYSQIKTVPYAEAKRFGFIEEIEDELDKAYFDKLSSLSLFKGYRDLSIVYSSLHGTGIYVLPKALAQFGFQKVAIVEEQAQPDGNFPTVDSPNPEDPRSLELALKLGEKQNADVVLATDPDSDRLAVVVREEEEWKMFSGNQMGALLFDFVLSQLKRQDRLPKSGMTVKTVVTSDLLSEISKYYGIPCEETLTGFKWICDLTEDYESGKLKPYKEFICGAEESYGFLAGTFVRDKDAALSAVMACEMLAYYKSLNKPLSEALDDLFMKHGVYHEHLETITLPGKEGEEKMRTTMKTLRENPPLNLADFNILKIKDYLHHQTKIQVDGVYKFESKIPLPASDVLEFKIEGGQLIVRPSGTEPKIKIYMSVFESSKTIARSDLGKVKSKLETKARTLLSSFLKHF
jgi:phosphoglucomutase